MRKIQNADAQKSIIYQALIKELRMDLKQKDVKILNLKLELDAANYFMDTENTDNVATENRQLKEQAIQFTKTIMKLKADMLALQDKLKNVDPGNSVLSSEANFKNEVANKDLDIIKSAPENRCKCVERIRPDKIRNLNELKTVDHKSTQTHLVEDICKEADPELASLAPDANFSPPHCPEYHQPAAQCENIPRRRPRRRQRRYNERQLTPSLDQKGLVPQTMKRGAVLMVYGLVDDTSNTDKVFNLVCLYGNVVRIRIVKTKCTAMVEMEDYVAAERFVKAIGHNGHIRTEFSTKSYLSDERRPHMLPDHTPGYKDYTASKNNRFPMTNKDLAREYMKNGPLAPTKFLFFWNTPCGIKESDLMKLFNSQGCEPKAVSMFPQKPEQQSSSGIIEFSHKNYAVLGIMKCNHMPIESKGFKFPFVMKLSFSSGYVN